MSNILNNFFSSVFIKESEDVPEVTKRFLGGDDQEMIDIVFTHHMLKSKINKLKEDKSSRDDGITPKFLKTWLTKLHNH